MLLKRFCMTSNSTQLEHLKEIRNLMESSSRFLSLSGLSGVTAGLFAIIGAFFAFQYLDYTLYWPAQYDVIFASGREFRNKFLMFMFIDASSVLLLAVSFALWFSIRKAKKKGLNIWDKVAKLTLINLLIPLFTGGIFCLILVFVYKQVYLIASLTLIFYGLALLNASKYTLKEVRYLGISEIALGLVSAVFVGYGLLFWTIGFGLLHIIYGAVMYYRYDR